MEIRLLKYFLTVAREENITRAAEKLHISQPALSRQLMQLEEELGARLFVRGRRNTALTDEGMLLRRRAQEIIDLAEKTENEFRAGAEAVGGVISIGSGEADTMRVLGKVMREFGKLYPAVRFEIYSNNADYVKERLERGSLDIGVLLGNTDLSGYDGIVMPGRERWGALLSASHPLAGKESVTREDLLGVRMLMPKRGAAQGIADWFGGCFPQLEIYAVYNLINNAAMLVESGIGAALTIEGAVSLYRNPDIVFRPLSPELSMASTLVWKKGRPVSRAVSKFIAFLREFFENVPEKV